MGWPYATNTGPSRGSTTTCGCGLPGGSSLAVCPHGEPEQKWLPSGAAQKWGAPAPGHGLVSTSTRDTLALSTGAPASQTQKSMANWLPSGAIVSTPHPARPLTANRWRRSSAGEQPRLTHAAGGHTTTAAVRLSAVLPLTPVAAGTPSGSTATAPGSHGASAVGAAAPAHGANALPRRTLATAPKASEVMSEMTGGWLGGGAATAARAAAAALPPALPPAALLGALTHAPPWLQVTLSAHSVSDSGHAALIVSRRCTAALRPALFVTVKLSA